jgi:large subunit ribosomal protein L29
MKVSEMRGKNPAELKDHLYALLKEQFNLRMQRGSGQLSRPSEMKRVRREIAQVKTVMTELKMGGAS